MRDEVGAKVKELFEAWTLKHGKLGAREVAAKVLPPNADLDAWAWSRPGWRPDTVVTLWAEAIEVRPDGRWVYCESLDRYNRKSKRTDVQARINHRIQLIEAAAGGGREMLALPQINTKYIAEIWGGKTSKIDQRINDDTHWCAVGYTKGDREIFLVRGAKPGDSLSEEDRTAARVRWTEPRSTPPVAAAFDIDTAPVLFVPVPWMQRYGADGHAADSDDMARWNFAPHKGWLYGHIPNAPDDAPDDALERLNAPANAPTQSGVLVVWTACHPLERIHKVVGWYKAATVLRRPASLDDPTRPGATYSVKAAAEDGTALAVADRRLALPVNVAEPLNRPFTETDPDFLARLRDLVKRPPAATPPSPAQQTGRGGRSGPRQPDVETRLAVEKAAMDAAIEYFPNAQDVSARNLGWDMTVPGGDTGQETYVEVKGLSGTNVRFELTPNEYGALRQYGPRYILFVLTSALEPDARIHVFTPEGTPGVLVWQTADGRRLNFTERTGAVVDLE